MLLENGKFPRDAMLVLDALPPGEPDSATSVPVCPLKLLMPPASAALMGIESNDAKESTEVSAQGHFDLSGSVFGFAYVAKREPFSKAVAELKVSVN